MNLPNVPRGIGLSKRFLYLMTIGTLLLMVTFLYFLHHYAPKKRNNVVSETSVNHAEAAHLIESLQIENKTSQPIATSTVVHDESHVKKTDQQFMQAASQAAISVYHTEHTDHTNSIPTSIPESSETLQMPNNAEPNVYQAQNQQSEKEHFLEMASLNRESIIKSQAQLPLSPYELKAGTLLPATLQTGIQSDLPGTIIAKIRQDV